MNCIREGWGDLKQNISGFVVVEDQRLGKRALRKVYSICHSVRERVVRFGAEARALIQRAGILARLTSFSARGRDLGALVWFVTRKLGLLVLAAPRGFQIAMAGAFIFALILGSDISGSVDSSKASLGVSTPVSYGVASPAQAAQMTQAGQRTSGQAAATWVAVSAPIPSYHLESPELDRATPKYRARRHSGGARQDIMLFGDFSASATGPKARPVGAVSIEVSPGQVLPSDSLFVEVARRAALVGASVERVASSTEILTKFGAFEVADATIATEAGSRGCLVYRHVTQDIFGQVGPSQAGSFQVHGWFCGVPSRPVDRARLACIIDRIDLLGAGDDVALKAYFAGVERARKPCGGYKVAGEKAVPAVRAEKISFVPLNQAKGRGASSN